MSVQGKHVKCPSTLPSRKRRYSAQDLPEVRIKMMGGNRNISDPVLLGFIWAKDSAASRSLQ